MDVQKMSSAERAERYSALAEEARRQAHLAKSTDVKNAYLTIAIQWDRLALVTRPAQTKSSN